MFPFDTSIDEVSNSFEIDGIVYPSFYETDESTLRWGTASFKYNTHIYESECESDECMWTNMVDAAIWRPS